MEKNKNLMENRTLEDIHRDVYLANNYRLEYIKHLMSIAAGIFVISIAFMSDIIKDTQSTNLKSLLIGGWGCLIFSLIGGIFHMKSWDRFFTSFRKPMDIGQKRRNRINILRKISEFTQILFFLLGLILIFTFVTKNI